MDVADIWKRVLAYLVDMLSAIILVLILGIVFSKITLNGANLAPLFFFIYYFFKDAMANGQSIGKRILKIKVVNVNTKNYCTLSQSFIRNVCHLLSIFDWVFIFIDKDKRRLGDKAANTIVLNC